MKKVYVGNMPYSLSEEDLSELFSTFGKVNEIAIPTDRESGRVKGFAFVTMEVDSEAEAAIATLNDREISGRRIVVNEAREKGSPSPSRSSGPRDSGNRGPRSGGSSNPGTKLYITNLAYNLTEDELADAFRPYGTVETTKIILDKDTGRSRGFAFVTMSSAEEARTAIESVDGQDIGGRAVMVKEAENKPRNFR